jgi:hypothetical protein
MLASFTLEDVPWIADAARRIWSNDPDRADNPLQHLLSAAPQPQFALPDFIDLAGDPFSDAYKQQVLKLWKLLYEAGTGKRERATRP